ncbi:EamA family transporter [Pseudooceanicola aestuarii]|uniref:EamA family transporter n=1 Tax=Pseudooceanicola aestuarii TaxID=2697319 RepID=UPI0013D48388|nr:EamA family transporter [Pseudooceanicola aestuarii]
MTGEGLAVLAALAYGLAGVLITRSRGMARGDNGVFLSVAMTALIACGLWSVAGPLPLAALLRPGGLTGLAIFALAGLCANVVGRQTMFRATEGIGAVPTGLLRRLTPVLALPLAALFLHQLPNPATLLGGALVLGGVLAYMRRPAQSGARMSRSGLAMGLLSPLAYAVAYTLRSLGLDHVADAALGTFVGAMAGGLWMLGAAILRRGAGPGWRDLTRDVGPRHLQTALALSVGQILQFQALRSASVLSVAVLGTLEVLFSALIIVLFTRDEAIALPRLLAVSVLAMIGTALLML